MDTAIVPKKPEIPVGTLRSILSQAHIDPEQWDKLAFLDFPTQTCYVITAYAPDPARWREDFKTRRTP